MSSALTKAFDVIRVLRRTPTPMTLTAIAEAIKVAPSTAHSVLGDLLAEGVVSQDEGKRYSTGPALYYWGSSYARSTPIYRSLWRELVDLCNELNVVGALAVPWDQHHLILQAHHAEPSAVGVAFGGRVPLDAGSWGKAYYAWSGTELPKRLHGYTAATATDLARYAEDVKETAQRGFATDVEEFEDGVGAVASGVTGERGYEGLASCLGTIDRFNELGFDEVGQRLAAIVSRASFTLGDPARLRLVGAE